MVGDRLRARAALSPRTVHRYSGGTVTRPKLDPSVLGQLGRQTIQNAAQSFLQKNLNKGLEKLFK